MYTRITWKLHDPLLVEYNNNRPNKTNRWSQCFDKKATSPPHMAGSIVFARLS